MTMLAIESDQPPLQPEQEWANALTHGIAAIGAMVATFILVSAAASKDIGLAVACAVYALSVFGTFLTSALSHAILKQPMLNTLRAWDQALIYAMIAGTYTPIIFAYAPGWVLTPLMIVMWIAAAVGFLRKTGFRHRVNKMEPVSYLMLGWLPAIPLVGHVPSQLAWAMLAGGMIYTMGVILLLNDRKLPYMHAGWHLFVVAAATCHFLSIRFYVVATY